MTGPFFWSRGVDWNTTDPKELEACRDFYVQLGPHIKYFDTSPGTSGRMASGELSLVQGFNGDLRQGLLNDQNPDRWRCVFPEVSEIWIDNWALVDGAPNADGAYVFLDHLLQPDVALKETEFTGYNTGVRGMEESAKEANTKYPELIFFTGDQMAKWTMSEVNSGRQTLVDIWNATKAAAGKG
jgi:spermidine/putrescine transport system substrate-binding protein